MSRLRNPDGATINLACRDSLSFWHFLVCHLSYIYMGFYNPREITGARFYVLNPRLRFPKARIVNRCQVIRNTETCEIFLKPRYLNRCVSIYFPVKLAYMQDFFFFFSSSFTKSRMSLCYR